MIHGDPGIPVLSVHGIGDLFVPLSMDQQYDAMMVAHGEGGLFVDRAIREVTHCGYTTSELSSAFSALVSWIHTGKRPPATTSSTRRRSHRRCSAAGSPTPLLVPTRSSSPRSPARQAPGTKTSISAHAGSRRCRQATRAAWAHATPRHTALRGEVSQRNPAAFSRTGWG